MKKTFKKLLALFLTGTMLAGVGCKDYDDDIDKINDRIDELTTGKIADIESQLLNSTCKCNRILINNLFKFAEFNLQMQQNSD